jgi:HTH-type transcriptional regulator/antitoxin HigA
MADEALAEAFPPGELLKEEIEERGWTQTELANILGVSLKTVSEVITGRRTITPDMAKALSEAFGTSAILWMNLDSIYQLWKRRSSDSTIARRAKLYSTAPVNEMVRRGWIENSDNIDVLEKRVLDYLGPELPHAAKKSTPYSSTTPAQRAWLARACQLATTIVVAPFSEKQLKKCVAALRTLMEHAEEARHVPKICAEHGIRFLIVEALPQSRIDGATFWLDEKSPVIVLSLRYDRVDAFWHGCFHEFGHVKEQDGMSEPVVDTDLTGEQRTDTDKPECERAANRFAEEALVPQQELEGWMVRVRPLYSRVKIRGFAARMKVHPALVVGQLQHRREIPWSHSRDMLEKIRHIVIPSALTDGWGSRPPANAR